MKPRTSSSCRLDPQSREPAYQQLARMLAQQIISGQSAAGSLLPEERELAQIHKVSRCTVRRALDVLQDQGLIQRIRRRGTIVAGEPSGKRWFSTAGSILAVFIGQPSGESQPKDPYLASMYGGIRQMARKLGLPVRTEGLRSYARVSLDEYRPPKPSEVGGVIVCGAFDEQYIRMFGSEGVPVIALDYWTHSVQADSVIVDVESDAYMAMEHLAGKGHIRVGFVALGRKERGTTTDRSEYDPDIHRMLDHLRRAGRQLPMDLRDEWICLIPRPGVPAVKAIQEMLSLPQRPTSLICFSEGATYAVLQAIREAGLRCPEEISLVTRGESRVAGRQVTSLVASLEWMGQLAVKLLLERMHGQRDEATRVAVVSRLVQGETTGPVRR